MKKVLYGREWLLFFVTIYQLILTSNVLATNQAVTWQLENYNEWNLPFAKTIDIVGRKSGTEREYDKFISGRYKLEVDASATFTVLFMPHL